MLTSEVSEAQALRQPDAATSPSGQNDRPDYGLRDGSAAVRNRVRDPSEYLRLGMTEYPLPGFLSVFGSCAGGVAGEY